MFENRTYRARHQKKNLVSFQVTVKETNLHIQAATDLYDLALRSVLKYRGYIESYAMQQPDFIHSLSPLPVPRTAPAIVMEMADAAVAVNVGPMAAVAGAVAEYTGRDLLACSGEVVVENGGDIFIKSDSDTTFAIYAGDSPLSLTTGIRIKKKPSAFALCTSSGMIGHSRSFGKADAVTVISRSCCLADAAATALGNIIRKPADIQKAITRGRQIRGIDGLVIIKGKNIGLWGEIELVPLD